MVKDKYREKVNEIRLLIDSVRMECQLFDRATVAVPFSEESVTSRLDRMGEDLRQIADLVGQLDEAYVKEDLFVDFTQPPEGPQPA